MYRTLTRAIAGDPDAAEAVAQALRPRLARMAAYYARCSGEDPDDLLQEAWLGVLEALPGLDLRIGSPEQHLIQRARWRLLDAVRRGRRLAPPERRLRLDDAGEEALPCPAVETAFNRACVDEFARQLKATQQAVLRCLLAGLTWREAGALLGCTSANVAYHVRQIRRAYESWSQGS